MARITPAGRTTKQVTGSSGRTGRIGAQVGVELPRQQTTSSVKSEEQRLLEERNKIIKEELKQVNERENSLKDKLERTKQYIKDIEKDGLAQREVDRWQRKRDEVKEINKELSALQESKKYVQEGKLTSRGALKYADAVGDARRRRQLQSKELKDAEPQLTKLGEAKTREEYARIYATIPSQVQQMISLKPASPEAMRKFKVEEKEVKSIVEKKEVKSIIGEKLKAAGITSENAQLTKPSKKRKIDKFVSDTFQYTPTERYGQLYVTPEEFEESGSKLGKSRPYYVLSPSSNEQDIVEEAMFASSLPSVISGKTTLSGAGQYQQELSIIKAGQEYWKRNRNVVNEFKTNPQQFEGEEGITKKEEDGQLNYSATPEWLQSKVGGIDYSASAKDAIAEYKLLPTSTRAGKTALSIGAIGATFALALPNVWKSAFAGFATGGTAKVNEGTGEFESGFTGTKPIGGEFAEGIKEMSVSSPRTYSGVSGFLSSPGGYFSERAIDLTTVTKASLVVGGGILGIRSIIKNIKTSGVQGGIGETLSELSPIKIQSGVYGGVLKPDTQFDDASFQSNTQRVTVGRNPSGNIRVYSMEKFTKAGGVEGSVVYRGDIVRIGGGGTIVEEGVATSGAEYLTPPQTTGDVLLVKPFNIKVLPPYNLPGGLYGQNVQVLNVKGTTGQVEITSSFSEVAFPSEITWAFISTPQIKFSSGMVTTSEGPLNIFSAGTRKIKVVPSSTGGGSRISIGVNKNFQGFQIDTTKINTIKPTTSGTKIWFKGGSVNNFKLDSTLPSPGSTRLISRIVGGGTTTTNLPTTVVSSTPSQLFAAPIITTTLPPAVVPPSTIGAVLAVGGESILEFQQKPIKVNKVSTPSFIESTQTVSSTKQGTKTVLVRKVKEDTIQDQIRKTGTLTSPVLATRTDSLFKDLTKTKTKTLTKTQTITAPISQLTTSQTIVTSRVPPPGFVGGFFFGLPGARPQKFQKKQGYKAQVLSRGKWKVINKKPLTKQAATSLGARAVDETTSRRFKVTPTKGKVTGIGNDPYFGLNQQKFRPYRIRRGTKKKLPPVQYIEKTSFAIDTPGEKAGLSLAKWKKRFTGKKLNRGKWLV